MKRSSIDHTKLKKNKVGGLSFLIVRIIIKYINQDNVELVSEYTHKSM